ncbi:cation:dicarboxylate symporter family transporter [Clostridium butyricum]|uniref:cation:dicarboxylate symporter family transporter n=1 Tax=Clostridium butyricum TaxID=1492 RepID=UPI0013D87930|nr:cation:dicarboxylase symporter family transporter [Clostridium butyricum]MCQ2016653.1 cation:dicarboxylase symporter family transporter [Clostridium butyricum]MCQ2020566.1 cation:dicarboxylase symporter family transporter [Clostridium butyricum]NFB69689.1 cation:dicarboxylase symporter family transporter [Clostridium butyricum]NFB89162.1 cation:dicarboxylase symporter family transporter [Clostridium butyricum]UTY54275.1 cation:dicarboxylase symporter family transporter [Clostridium butyricu
MNSTFFTDFVMITSFMPIVFIGLLLGMFFVIRQMEKKKINFSKRMIVATLLGLLLGVVIQAVAKFPDDIGAVTWITETTKWYGLVGYGFMDLLKMLVVPLIFLSIIRVIINMKADQNLGKLTSRTILVLLSTTAISAIIAIIVGNLFKLGVGETVVQSQSEMKEISSIVDTLRGLLPSNPVKAMADANVVGVVIFAGFIGIAIKRLTKKYLEIVKPAIDLVEAGYKIITSVAMTVIKFMPYAVIALLANTIAGRGMSAIISVTKFIAAIYVSIGLVFVFHMIIISLNKLNPFRYIKNVAQPLILAFTSRSSLGTLPVTIEALTEKAGVDNGVASFVGSLGSNMGMNGCAAVYPALMAITIANMSGTPMDLSFYGMLLVIIIVSSLGIAGLPGTATMAVSVVISGMGMGAYFPLAGGILAIDPILDMGRTMLNVNGTMVTAVTVANSLDNIDKDVYNK